MTGTTDSLNSNVQKSGDDSVSKFSFPDKIPPSEKRQKTFHTLHFVLRKRKHFPFHTVYRNTSGSLGERVIIILN